MQKIKTSTTILFVFFGVLNAGAQGSVGFSNDTATRVYLHTPTGMTPVPAGSQYTAELVYAPDGTSANEFSSVAIRVGATTTFGPVAGLFSGGGRTVNSISPPGGFGLFQVRVWSTSAGATYEAALSSSFAQTGWSQILRVDTGDPTTTPPGTATSLVSAGLTSFCVGPIGYGGPCVPEPSSVLLGLVLGSIALLLRVRNHCSKARARVSKA